MELPDKLKRAASNPDLVGPYARNQYRAVKRMMATGRALESLPFLFDEVFDTDLHPRYLRWSAHDDVVQHRINDYEMYLPVDDRGISRALMVRGVHEAESTAVFRAELERLADELSTVTVVEVGANIGYYCLLALTTLGERARMVAVEPVPETAALLRRNLDLNGYTDVPVHELALSDYTGRGTMFLSPMSNWCRLDGPHFSDDGRRLDVATRTGDQFVRDRGIDPADVNVVRMDVEGHESQTIRGMREIFAADGPLLAFIEIHDEVRKNGELDAVLRPLIDNEFEVLSSSNSLGIEITEVADLYDFPFDTWCNPQVILRRG